MRRQQADEDALEAHAPVLPGLHGHVGLGEAGEGVEQLLAREALRRLVLHPEPVGLLLPDLVLGDGREHRRLPLAGGGDPLWPPATFRAALALHDHPAHGPGERADDHERRWRRRRSDRSRTPSAASRSRASTALPSAKNGSDATRVTTSSTSFAPMTFRSPTKAASFATSRREGPRVVPDELGEARLAARVHPLPGPGEERVEDRPQHEPLRRSRSPPSRAAVETRRPAAASFFTSGSRPSIFPAAIDEDVARREAPLERGVEGGGVVLRRLHLALDRELRRRAEERDVGLEPELPREGLRELLVRLARRRGRRRPSRPSPRGRGGAAPPRAGGRRSTPCARVSKDGLHVLLRGEEGGLLHEHDLAAAEEAARRDLGRDLRGRGRGVELDEVQGALRLRDERRPRAPARRAAARNASPSKR